MNSPSDLVLVTVTLAVFAVGCRDCRQAPTPTATVEVRVDAAEVDYVYRAPDGRLRTAGTLAEIPTTVRGAVMVHHPAMTGARRDTETVYVADLLGAEPGDTIEARPSTREAFTRRTTDLRNARHHATLVYLASRRFTEFRRDSDRSAAAEEAGETFRNILPRLAPPTSERDTGPDAGDTGDTGDTTLETGETDENRIPRPTLTTPP